MVNCLHMPHDTTDPKFKSVLLSKNYFSIISNVWFWSFKKLRITGLYLKLSNYIYLCFSCTILVVMFLIIRKSFYHKFQIWISDVVLWWWRWRWRRCPETNLEYRPVCFLYHELHDFSCLHQISNEPLLWIW